MAMLLQQMRGTNVRRVSRDDETKKALKEASQKLQEENAEITYNTLASRASRIWPMKPGTFKNFISRLSKEERQELGLF